jgi:integrase
MAISQYEENGQKFWRVTVHVRSSKNRNKRVQKKLSKLTSENIAKREEKRLYREVIRKMAIIDGKGLYWEDVVHLWICDLKEGLDSQASSKSIYDYRTILSLWTEDWNEKQVSDISIADGKELFRNLLNSKRSFAYQKKIKNLINRIFKWSIENRFIEKHIVSPVQGLTIQKTEEKVPEILSLVEIKKLLRTAKENGHFWYPIWTMALNTGMRSGELYALTWDQIDLEKNLIMVHQSFDTFTKSIGPTKGRYWRVVPIAENLRSFLIELKATSKEENEFVLPHSRTWLHGDQAVVLKEFLSQISLRPVKFHTLRACWATQMLASGVPAAVVMRIGGWKRSSTMDIYLRLAGVDVKGATDCLDFIPEERNYHENVVNLFN